MNPFPAQQQQMVAQFPAQQPTNPNAATPSRASSSSINILMADSIDLTMQAKSYEKQPEGESFVLADYPPMPQSNGPLTIDKLTFEPPSCPSKGALQCTTHNLHVHSVQHYNIVEDLSQAPCAMSILEVLQSCPTQWKYLINAIGAINAVDASLLFFDPEKIEPMHPYPTT